MTEKNKFAGEITVSSKIVDHLSSGLYESPAACLKELINNSYDADAKIVNIFVKPDADRIIIEDDGVGLTKEEFIRHFKRISETQKRNGKDFTKSHRPLIGKIGIGFIAANEICDEMELHSKKLGSDKMIKVTINFAKMRSPDHARRRGKTKRDLAKGDYDGIEFPAPQTEHYTKIFLKKVRGAAKEILTGASKSGEDKPTLYGLKVETIEKRLKELELETWSELDPYSRNMLEVALNIPVKYFTNWIPPKLKNLVKQYETSVKQLNFKVFYDGVELRKPVILFPNKKSPPPIGKEFHFEGKKVSARGYFYAQHGTIKPQELNGVLIRIRNAAVGKYDPKFLDFPGNEGPLFQRWISGELWANDGLEEAMIIDRKTFRITNPAYRELQIEFHKFLSKFIKNVREEIYEPGSAERKFKKSKEELLEIRNFVEKKFQPNHSIAAKKILVIWDKIASSKNKRKKILKKYSVSDLYKLILEASDGNVSSATVENLILEITRKISE